MKWYLLALGLLVIALVVLSISFISTPEPIAGDFFYAITSKGVLCGYSVVDTSLVDIEGERVILLERTGLSKRKLMGMNIDSEIKVTYHLDPESLKFLYNRFDETQGKRQFETIKIDKRT